MSTRPDTGNTSTDVEESSLTPVGSCLLHTASRTSKNDSCPSHMHTDAPKIHHLTRWPCSKTNMFLPFFFSDKVEKLEVILGRTFRKQNSSSEQIFKVEKYWIHDKFDNETFDNDIGE